MHYTALAASALTLALASCGEPAALTYDDVVGLPRQEQIAALSVASPAEISAIYRAHFTRVAARPEVTPDERATLAQISSLLTTEADAASASEVERLVRTLGPGTMRAAATLGE